MSKVITLDKPKENQLKGITAAVDAMKITIGPRGENVSLSNGEIVNDGKRIIEDISLKDSQQNKGITKVRTLVRRISSDVGGGRTACAILYQNLCRVGVDLLERGFNGNLIKKGMELAVKDITAQLDTLAQPIEGRLKEIATISTESEELGTVIAETIEKVGLDSVVKVEESNTFGITSSHEEGLKFDKGYVSPYMVTNDRLEAEYTDIPVLITDKKISFFKEIMPIMDELVAKNKKSLLIIAEDFEGEALNISILAKMKGQFNVLAVKAPGIGDNKKFCFEDLCALTGAELWTEQSGEPVLGIAKSITAKKDSSIIIGSADLQPWITTLKDRAAATDNKWEIDQFNERIAKLSNGIAIIKVGSSSEDDVKYIKLKVEDGVNETKRALEEGIVMGGNVAFIHATNEPRTIFTSKEEQLGYEIVFKAVEAPLRQIVINGNGSPDVVVDDIRNATKPEVGFNSLTNKIVPDMYKLGIIDAVKVVKTVLQYAVADASIFLTIGGDISEEVIETK